MEVFLARSYLPLTDDEETVLTAQWDMMILALDDYNMPYSPAYLRRPKSWLEVWCDVRVFGFSGQCVNRVERFSLRQTW